MRGAAPYNGNKTMLEILILVKFTRYLASVARNKGRSSAWAALGAVFWIGGEVFGFLVGALAGMEDLAAYLPALICAALGAAAAYGIVALLPAVVTEPAAGFADYPGVTKSRFG
jgi:hypothetical protein